MQQCKESPNTRMSDAGELMACRVADISNKLSLCFQPWSCKLRNLARSQSHERSGVEIPKPRAGRSPHQQYLGVSGPRARCSSETQTLLLKGVRDPVFGLPTTPKQLDVLARTCLLDCSLLNLCSTHIFMHSFVHITTDKAHSSPSHSPAFCCCTTP